jgi:hypothetical protein
VGDCPKFESEDTINNYGKNDDFGVLKRIVRGVESDKGKQKKTETN